MTQNNSVSGVKLSDKKNTFCEACQLDKCHRVSFKSQETKINREPGEYIHSDVSGPMSKESLGGARFFVTFKDEASGYRHIYFMKHKADVFEYFKKFEVMIANKFGRPMRILHSDNGKEYVNSSMQSYLNAKGIRLETTSPYCPEQNGKVEGTIERLSKVPEQ
jgi:transposase InsO family protein